MTFSYCGLKNPTKIEDLDRMYLKTLVNAIGNWYSKIQS